MKKMKIVALLIEEIEQALHKGNPKQYHRMFLLDTLRTYWRAMTGDELSPADIISIYNLTKKEE
jgi:hypothetical protein